jgi:hypothetical protein
MHTGYRVLPVWGNAVCMTALHSPPTCYVRPYVRPLVRASDPARKGRDRRDLHWAVVDLTTAAPRRSPCTSTHGQRKLVKGISVWGSRGICTRLTISEVVADFASIGFLHHRPHVVWRLHRNRKVDHDALTRPGLNHRQMRHQH